MGDRLCRALEPDIEHEGRRVRIPTERSQVGDSSGACGGLVRTDDHADAPLGVASAGVSQGLDAGVLGGDVDFEGQEILRYQFKHVLDLLQFTDREAGRIAVEIVGRRDDRGDVPERVPASVGRGVAVEVEIDDLRGARIAVQQEGVGERVAGQSVGPADIGILREERRVDGRVDEVALSRPVDEVGDVGLQGRDTQEHSFLEPLQGEAASLEPLFVGS